jgi:hypothetical protein
MENELDTNAANSPDRTADMTTQEITIKKTDYAGNEAAARTMERSLNQATGSGMDARSNSQDPMGMAHEMARQARFTNLSNRGAGE